MWQVFLGDQSVGKTSIITRFMYDKFDNTYQVCTYPMIAFRLIVVASLDKGGVKPSMQVYCM